MSHADHPSRRSRRRLRDLGGPAAIIADGTTFTAGDGLTLEAHNAAADLLEALLGEHGETQGNRQDTEINSPALGKS